MSTSSDTSSEVMRTSGQTARAAATAVLRVVGTADERGGGVKATLPSGSCGVRVWHAKGSYGRLGTGWQGPARRGEGRARIRRARTMNGWSEGRTAKVATTGL